ncbi:(2,3-dihydroxybenzoyl)adenylate synthase [Klugiella xanthotipulae]|uniref:2,3-dihydroxybenzoate-AMP ligase n=1 Tax=Klugiella xanthotipulae TaxID=244735 RepID=A0A543HHC1_9MICO|nr:AMP-binding protein [Klugiella xanthotipulae]TQM57713.1 2,3-dihydroxybenzoate-AMP ligase [Klugiella xanthotipulae]
MIPGATPYPAERAATYRAAGYWRGATFGALLRESATRWPGNTAVTDGHTRLSYAQLDAAASTAATRLARLGIRPRERVVLHLPNTLPYLPVLFGLFRLGALPVCALPGHRQHELSHVLRRSGAPALITVERHLGVRHGDIAREAAARVDLPAHPTHAEKPAHPTVFTDPASLYTTPDPITPGTPGRSRHEDPADIAFLQLSGGSTGIPKLIPRTADDYLYSVRASNEVCRMTDRDVYLAVLPVAHNFTMSSPGILGTLLAGGTVVLAAAPSPDVCFPLIDSERVTVTAIVPPLAPVWLDALPARPALSSLRLLQVGGARLAPEVARRLLHRMPGTLQQVFGMAEGLVSYTRLDDTEEAIIHTQGRPLSPHDEIRVVDDGDTPVAAGISGHLLTRGPYTINGYFDAPQTNATSFTDDGFYRTGDIVRLRPDGAIEVRGRSGDIINRAGEKISAEEVENLLLSHPAVHEAIVVGRPDATRGEIIHAFIVPRSGVEATPALTAQTLGSHLTTLGTARYKFPDDYAFVATLPLTAVGKISRAQLRTQLAALLTEPAPQPQPGDFSSHSDELKT